IYKCGDYLVIRFKKSYLKIFSVKSQKVNVIQISNRTVAKDRIFPNKNNEILYYVNYDNPYIPNCFKQKTGVKYILLSLNLDTSDIKLISTEVFYNDIAYLTDDIIAGIYISKHHNKVKVWNVNSKQIYHDLTFKNALYILPYNKRLFMVNEYKYFTFIEI